MSLSAASFFEEKQAHEIYFKENIFNCNAAVLYYKVMLQSFSIATIKT